LARQQGAHTFQYRYKFTKPHNTLLLLLLQYLNLKLALHNMLLSSSIIIAIILFLVVSYSNDIAIKTHQQNHLSSLSSDKEVYRDEERMQFNPKLPIYIQNIILDSRQAVYNNDTSSSKLHTSRSIPSSIRKRRRELLYTPSNCIESYHVSIVPEEVNTCTNSNYYVSIYYIIIGYISHHSVIILHSSASYCI
jgi:hypothetical protein